MAKTRAKKVDPEWEKHRPELKRLYGKNTVKAIEAHMKREHGFFRTESEYRAQFAKWGLKKTSTSAMWKYAYCRIRKRKSQGKEKSAIYLHKRLVSAEKAKKEISRHVPPSFHHTCLEGRKDKSAIIGTAMMLIGFYFYPLTPEGIQVRTPVAHNDSFDSDPQSPDCIQAETSVTIEAGMSLRVDELSYFQFQNDLLHIFEVQRPRELDIDYSTANFQTPIDISYTTTLGNMPAFDFSYTPPQSAIMSQKSCSVLQGIDYNSQEYADFGFVSEELLREARAMLSECLQGRGRTPIFPAGEDIDDIALSLEPVMVEQTEGDLTRGTKKLFGPSKSNALVQFLQFCVYLSSNNLLTDDKTEGLLRWLTKNGLRYLLKDLLRSRSTTVQVFASNLLRIAVTQADIETSKILVNAGTETDAPSGLVVRRTALQEAIDLDGPECAQLVQMLLDAGANPNTAGGGNIPLCSAFGFFKRNTLELVRMLLDAGANPDPEQIPIKKTPLQLAAEQNRIDVVRLLLGAKAKPNHFAPEFFTPLQCACEKHDAEMVEMLVDAGADVNASHTPEEWKHGDLPETPLWDYEQTLVKSYRTPIQVAAEKLNWEAVQILLESGAEVNLSLSACSEMELEYEINILEAVMDLDSIPVFTPLQAAVKAKDIVMVRLLLGAGAHPDTRPRDDYGFTALQIAVFTKDKRLVRFLLQKGADINAPAGPYFGRSALQAAAMDMDDTDLLTLLIESGADVNLAASKRDGRTALQAAVEAKNVEAVKILIDAGADVNARPGNVWGRTALQIAALLPDNAEMIKILLKAGANVNAAPGHSEGIMALQAAVKSRDKQNVELLLKAGASINLTPILSGHSPLLQAVWDDNFEMAKLFLLKKANPNISPVDSLRPLTPLQKAAGTGNISLVELLLSYDADVNAPAFQASGRTCLQAAAESGSLPVIKALCRAGANPNAPPASVSGITALEAAVKNQSVEIVNFLLENDATISLTNCATRKRILSLAIESWSFNEDLIEILIKAGADVNPIKTHECSYLPASGVLLQQAARRASYNLVRTILKAGANVNIRSSADNGPVTAIQEAARRRNIDIVQVLLDYGADINAPANKSGGFTALQEAVSSGNFDIVRLLLDNGADVNAPPSPVHGRTALQEATSKGNVRRTQFLLQRGANVNAPAAPNSGVTALQGAAIAGNIRIVIMLLAAGADINGAPAMKNGRTAIEGAAENGRLDTVHLLLNYHPDTEDLELKRKRAAKLASTNGHFAISRFIKAYRKN